MRLVGAGGALMIHSAKWATARRRLARGRAGAAIAACGRQGLPPSPGWRERWCPDTLSLSAAAGSTRRSRDPQTPAAAALGDHPSRAVVTVTALAVVTVIVDLQLAATAPAHNEPLKQRLALARGPSSLRGAPRVLGDPRLVRLERTPVDEASAGERSRGRDRRRRRAQAPDCSRATRVAQNRRSRSRRAQRR